MNTPLYRYLEKHGLTQQDFADAMGTVRGGTVYQHQVSDWAAGKTYPSRESRNAMETLTEGEVSVKKWKSWRGA
jgi:transcriptional regulator with XRE-family HTH domain